MATPMKNNNTAPSKCLQAALKLLEEHHWKIFPARMEGSRKWSWLWAGHAPGQDENWGQTNDPGQLWENFSKKRWRDKCGVGIPTGAVNGIFVLDVDTPKGHDVDGVAALKQLENEHDKLPKTLMARSPTGSMHFYFRHPGNGIKITTRALAGYPGIDVKGDGGQVAAPPSVRPGVGAYKWINKAPIVAAPDWLITMIGTPIDTETPGASAGSSKGNGHAAERNWAEEYGEEQTAYPKPTVEELMAAATVAPNDDMHWDEWNKHGMAIFSAFPNADGLAAFDLLSSKSSKYDVIIDGKTGKQRTAAKWKAYFNNPPRSADDGGVTIGTFFALANEADPGWRARLRGQQTAATMPEKRPWPVLNPAALHGLAGEVVEMFSPHTESDPVAILMQFLVYFGSVLDRGVYHLTESDRQHSNLFLLLVGDTSKSRKGTSAGRLRELFSHVDPVWSEERVKGGLSSGEGVIWEVRDEVTRPGKNGDVITVVDEIADKRLMLDEREFFSALAVMKREGSIVSRIIRDAWDGKPIFILTKSNPTHCSKPHISIVGHITSGELARELDEISMTNGYANRFLFACVRRSKYLPFGGNLDPAAIEKMGKRVQQVFTKYYLTVKRIDWDAEARAVWEPLYRKLSEGRPGLLGSVTARAETQTVRLAMLYAVLDESDVIKLPHLEAALAVWRYCEDSAAHIFGDSLGDRVADAILGALRANGGMSRTDIHSLFARNLSASKIAMALTTLLAHGRVRREQQQPSSKGGRPTEIWLAS